MDTDDNKKITWTRSSKPNDAGTSKVEPNTDGVSGDPLDTLSQQAASYRATQTSTPSSTPDADIDALKHEIEATLAHKNTPTTDPNQTIVKSRQGDVVDIDAPDQTILANGADSTQSVSPTPVDVPSSQEPPLQPLVASRDQVAKENHEALVASLKDDIKTNFEDAARAESSSPQSGNTGVGQTYYSDLSKAMSANEPATMSELIRKARFEEKERTVLSPRSKKNIAFIVGALVLLVVSIGIISTFFKKGDTVEFITEERVSSLVRSNLDTGINTTGLDASRIKQAIRDVIEMKIPDDSINQIYYVENDGLGNLRRIGIKDIFDKTNNQTPEFLYDNIENTFTHGVYKTDKNYPFIIMKPLSYDRALMGMLEWEPTMIDDLATYLDLPPEATDRSLLKDGFEDDLINNKTVRVARFLPRDVDRRGILDFLGIESPGNPLEEGTIDTEGTTESDGGTTTVGETESLGFWQRFLPAMFGTPSAYAQTVSQVTGIVVEQAVDPVTGNTTTQPLAGVQVAVLGTTVSSTTNTGGGFTLLNVPGGSRTITFARSGYLSESITANMNTVGQLSVTLEAVPLGGQSFDDGDGGFIVGGGVDIVGNIDIDAVDVNPVCFDKVTGLRLTPAQQSQTARLDMYCFESYRCYRYSCFVGTTEVGVDNANQPGAVCRDVVEEGQVYLPDDPNHSSSDYTGSNLSCYQFFEIKLLPKINTTVVCFETATGTYLPNFNSNGAIPPTVTCLGPEDRAKTVCVDQNDKLYEPDDANAVFVGPPKYCFEPFDGAVTPEGGVDVGGGIGVGGGVDIYLPDDICSQIQQGTAEASRFLRQKAYELRIIANRAQLFGLSRSDADNLRSVANFLEQMSYGNYTQIELLAEGSQALNKLNLILRILGEATELPVIGDILDDDVIRVYDEIVMILRIIQCVLNLDGAWVTGDAIVQGTTFYAGASGEGVFPVQQTLVAIGLMDINSVTGVVDLVTQDAVSQFQIANGLAVTGVIDPDTLEVLLTIVNEHANVYGDAALINDYLDTDGSSQTSGGTQTIGLGTYSNDVQIIQVLLYTHGYDIVTINGLLDAQTCAAVQAYQEDQGLEVADDNTCTISLETIDSFNDMIRGEALLGSGFTVDNDGFLVGVGKFELLKGPGVANFGVNDVDADSLNEGDIVLMYMFLDEETILITRSRVVIDEVIKRRALEDIFT